MTKIKIYSIDGKIKGDVELPVVFNTLIRPDLIQRAVLALQANGRQPYGTDWFAGKRTSARYLGVKGKRNSMKNREMARGPRVVGSNPGQEFRMKFAPQARGGRRAHPPKAEKTWALKLNRKENLVALASAIAATASKEFVMARGHRISDTEVPVVVSSEMESLKKTRDMENLFSALKFDAEMERAGKSKVRAGRGKMRGRRYRKRVGPLFVVSEPAGLLKAARNLPGVDVATVSSLNVELLAPGAQPGRLTIWSEAAVKKLQERFG